LQRYAKDTSVEFWEFFVPFICRVLSPQTTRKWLTLKEKRDVVDSEDVEEEEGSILFV